MVIYFIAMLNQFNSLTELLDHFKEKKTCIKFLEKMRWSGNVTCPHFGHEKVYRLKEGYKCASSECYKKFSVIVGSIFEKHKDSFTYMVCYNLHVPYT